MDSILVVCYSNTGVSLRAARQLCSHHGWPLGIVSEIRSRAGFAGALRCVLDSLLRRKPRVRYQGPDPADYRTVVLVSPIWVWRLAGPMRSFVASHRAALRRVAVVSTMGSAGASNAVAEITHLLGHAPLRTVACRTSELEDGSAAARLIGFGHLLQPGTAEPAAQREAALHYS